MYVKSVVLKILPWIVEFPYYSITLITFYFIYVIPKFIYLFHGLLNLRVNLVVRGFSQCNFASVCKKTLSVHLNSQLYFILQLGWWQRIKYSFVFLATDLSDMVLFIRELISIFSFFLDFSFLFSFLLFLYKFMLVTIFSRKKKCHSFIRHIQPVRILLKWSKRRCVVFSWADQIEFRSSQLEYC